MQREIKFRVWDIRNKCFYLTGLSINIEDGSLVDECGIYSNSTIIQQFTGLKDRNGKEIYEGDFVKYNGDNDITYQGLGIVSIGDYFTHGQEFDHFGVRVKRLDMDTYFGLNRDSVDFLVVGNIFENPELLK